MSGVFSALVVLLCLYALTPAFYYIPDAILSAIIIHAVADLVSGPKFLHELYKISPFELFTFVSAVLITFFTSVEYGIYVSVCLSIAFMLLRIARPRYAVLGRIPVHPNQHSPASTLFNPQDETEGSDTVKSKHTICDENSENQYIYVRQDHQTLSHLVESPPPGVVIFRFDESLTYPNSGFISDKIMHYIQDNYASGSPPPRTKGERAWNDRRPLAKPVDEEQGEEEGEKQNIPAQPELRAIVLDCSAVNHLDSTGVQTLLDLKLTLNRYSGHEVEWHFASLASPSIRNALVASGFGSQMGRGPRTGELLPVVPAHRDGPQGDINSNQKHSDNCNNHSSSSSSSDSSGYLTDKKEQFNEVDNKETDLSIREAPNGSSDSMSESRCSRMSYVVNIDGEGQLEYYPRLDRGLPIDKYPFFHWDLEDAVRAATYTRRREDST
jgi:sodium-independent sulfate anion transporter 11